MSEIITLDEYKKMSSQKRLLYVESRLCGYSSSKFVGQIEGECQQDDMVQIKILYRIIYKDDKVDEVKKFEEEKVFSDQATTMVLLKKINRFKIDFTNLNDIYFLTLGLVLMPNDKYIFSIKDINTLKGKNVERDILNNLLTKLNNKTLPIYNEIEDMLAVKNMCIDKEMEKIGEKEKLLNNKNYSFYKYQQMEKIGFWNDIRYFPKEKNGPEKDSFATMEENVKYIQKYLAYGKKSLFYDLDTIRSVCLGLLTGQLVILNGKPGSGKSSLAEGIANAIGAEFYNVAVESNWMDKADLLGYYDSMNKKYVATEFLERLIDFCDLASRNHNEQKLFIICLDEMNLAYIEYYFADFLVQLQTKERRIGLYSTRIYQELTESFKAKINKMVSNQVGGGLSTETLSKSERQEWDRLSRYQPSLYIPPNIRFIGTINKDETTRDLSPKVIDRSYFIRVESPGIEKLITDEKSFDKNESSKYSKSIKLKNKNWKMREMDLNGNTVEKVLKDFEKDTNITFSPRIYSVLKNIVFKQEYLGKGFNFNDVIFSAIALPRISVDYSYEDGADEIKKIVTFLENQGLTYSKKIFNQMEDKRNQEYTYWR